MKIKVEMEWDPPFTEDEDTIIFESSGRFDILQRAGHSTWTLQDHEGPESFQGTLFSCKEKAVEIIEEELGVYKHKN
jgi:hypothetical protein